MKYAEIKELYEECKFNRQVLIVLKPIAPNKQEYKMSLHEAVIKRNDMKQAIIHLNNIEPAYTGVFVKNEIATTKDWFAFYTNMIDHIINWDTAQTRYERLGNTLGLFPPTAHAEWKLAKSIQELKDDDMV
jgi:hypothetical protein